MFHERLIDIDRRRERLLARSESQRAAVVQAFRRWEVPARAVDHAWSVVRFLQLHPVALAAAVAAGMVLGRRHLFKWAGRGLFAWRAWRTLSGWLRRHGI